MDEKRVAEIYDKLGTLVVELDPDPVSRGPAYLQDLIARVRGYLNQVSVFVQEAHREHHDLERRKDALQAAFDVEADRLLAEDGRVKRQPNIDDRKSMINLILTDERREIQSVEQELRSLGHVEKAIRHRQKELESTMSAIRLQRGLIQDEIRTGSFYGDESDKSRGDAWVGKKKGDDSVFDEELSDDEIAQYLGAAEEQLQAEAEGSEEEGEESSEESEEGEDSEEESEEESSKEEPMEAVETQEESKPDEDPAIEDFLNEDDDDFDGLFDEIEDD
jgi:hypothetical protein